MALAKSITFRCLSTIRAILQRAGFCLNTIAFASLHVWLPIFQVYLHYTCFIVWQARRAADTSTNWRQSLLCCCTASMEQAADEAETVAIDGLVSSWSENISVSFCLRTPGYGLSLWCALSLLVGGAIQVPQLQLQLQLPYSLFRPTNSAIHGHRRSA